MKQPNNQLSLCLVVLAIASCDFRHPSDLPEDGGATTTNGASNDAPAGPYPLSLELFAGDSGGFGDADGVGDVARLYNPTGVAVDDTGNVYVADQNNHTIREVTAAGLVLTLAGTANVYGNADGTGAAARFYSPTGVAVDRAGNLYVADAFNHTIRKVTPDGVVTTIAGAAGTTGSADGAGAAARFNYPSGVAVDDTGNVYVADSGNSVIRKITPDGVVTTLAGSAGNYGSANGAGSDAQFSGPFGVAVDRVGNVYVADEDNQTVRKVTPDGIVTTLAGTAKLPGSTDGTGAAARFLDPTGVAVDSIGNVYVADWINATIRKVSPAGVVTTLAGTSGVPGSTDDVGAAASFDHPSGVAVDGVGNVYVADQNNNVIRMVSATGVVTTLAGSPGARGNADGTGATRFFGPAGLAVNGAGNAYVADQYNDAIRVVSPAGVVTTLAGTPGASGRADGLGATARFYGPIDVAVDGADNVYVADQRNHAIRKITPVGLVSTLAGSAGVSGSADGNGTAARFDQPTGVAIDGAGNVYVADSNNNTIRMITSDGMVTTLAGTAGMVGSAEGMGPAARFHNPTDVALDGAGNLYVADAYNNAIRKITPAGMVTTLAGMAGTAGSADGTGSAARFNFPTGVAVDSTGNVYVADQRNELIRKVTPAGITTTVAGTAGVAGILLGNTPRFAAPESLAIVGDSIVVSDGDAILLLRHGAQ